MPVVILRFIGGADLISRGIQAATNSLWCHTELGVNPAGDTVVTGWLGAHIGGGFQERPLDYCKPEREKRYAIPVTQAQYDAIMAKAHSMVGTEYDSLDILGLLIHDRSIDNKYGVICSQSMTMVLEAGEVYALNVEPGFEHLVTPETLHLSPLLRGRCCLSVG